MGFPETKYFDNLWSWFSSSMSMEQFLEFALTSKVILSYEIDYLNSFHDRLMNGLWKRSPNGCFCKMDDKHEKLAYIILNGNYEADLEKSREKLQEFSNRVDSQKVYEEMAEPVLSYNESLSRSSIAGNSVTVEIGDTQISHVDIGVVESLEIESMRVENGGIHADGDELGMLGSCNLQEGEVFDGEHKVFDELPLPNFIKEIAENSTHEDSQIIPDDKTLERKSEVSNESSFMFNQDKLIKNVVRPLLTTYLKWFVDSSLLRILGKKAYYSRLCESKTSHKELLSFSNLLTLSLSPSCLDYKMLSNLKQSLGVLNCSLRTHIFDPGGSYCQFDWRDGYVFILATFLTLEGKGDFKREGECAMSTYVICETVSPYYAQELISGIKRGDELNNIVCMTGVTGIVNGMEVGLAVEGNIRLFELTRRLEEVKGYDFLTEVIHQVVKENNVQITAKKGMEQQTQQPEILYCRSSRVAKFNLSLSHVIQCCDELVLWISGPGIKRAPFLNVILRGFEVIDDSKSRLDPVCFDGVSSVDILTLAAGDSIVLTGGRIWGVYLERRDGRVSPASYSLLNSASLLDPVSEQRWKLLHRLELDGHCNILVTNCNQLRNEMKQLVSSTSTTFFLYSLHCYLLLT